MNTYCYQYPYHLLLIVMLLMISWAFTFGIYKERHRVSKLPFSYIDMWKHEMAYRKMIRRIKKWGKEIDNEYTG